MNDAALRQVLDKVAGRYRRLLTRTALAACWFALAVAGLVALLWARGAGYAVPGLVLVLLVAGAVLVVPALLAKLRSAADPLWVARRVEQRFPDLDARLLAAVEQKAAAPGGALGFLQQTVIAESLEHAARNDWDRQLVPDSKLAVARLAQWATLFALAFVSAALVADMWRRPGAGGSWFTGGAVVERGDAFSIKVEPEDTEVERGGSLLVLARFDQKLPGDVQLLYRDAGGAAGEVQAAGQDVRQMPMSKSLDDPLFAGRVTSVDRDMTYSIKYGDQQTRWFKVGVFDYPDLQRADAKLKFPQYTGVPEKTVEDTRSVTAVEGTNATFTFRLNKPVSEAQLLPAKGQAAAGAGAGAPATAPATEAAPVKLAVDPSDPSVYSVAFDLKQSQRFKLHLVDEKGRKNKSQAELVVNVVPNRPPELKLEWPGHDVDVSPLEELSVRAQVWDDFGVRKVGMSYGIAGEETQEVELPFAVAGAATQPTSQPTTRPVAVATARPPGAPNAPAASKGKQQVAQLLNLEKLGAEPDQLLSYYLWVEDVGPDGNVRRTSGDMFFAEVRPFEQIFRQGQQPSASEQQQQQQQGGQNAQQAEELAELQKQIINATWKILRREISATLTPQFVPDVKTVSESQGTALEKATELGEKLQDEKSKQHLASALKHMEKARGEFDKASGSGAASVRPAVKPLETGLSTAQAAYQALLKLRAREHEVVRGNQRQRQQGSQSASANRRQQQLNELELSNEQNRYETQRQAATQQENPEQRETRQVMNRLRELAQRQEDLNRQMRELQSALQEAKDQQEREEIQRQLARLSDQQQQMLRDADELRDRMDQPENQQRMADARQQLEETRQNLRRASEALEQGQVPDAASAGARAGEQLGNLRDEFRKANAGQFNERMDRMRQEARQLDQKQQELAQQLAELDKAERPALRDSGGRAELADGLGQQKQGLDKLMEEMKQTVEESEQSEPLLSSRLYDTIRQSREQQPGPALDMTRQLLDRGFVDQAKVAESDAGKGITKLRQGVEKAAESVLGDETEALRRARSELDSLARDLDNEVRRNGGGDTGATTRPSGERFARGGPTTRQGSPDGAEQGEREGGEGPTTRPEEGLAQGEQLQEGKEGQQGQTGQRRGGARPQDAQASARRPGQRGQPGQQGQPGQEGQQGQEGQPGQEGQQGEQGQGQAQAQGQGQEGQQGQQGQRGQGQGQGTQQARGGRQPGQQPGQRGQRGQGGQQGEGGDQPGEGQESDQLADAGQEGQQPGEQRQEGQQGQRGQQGQQGGRGQRGGNQTADARNQRGSQQGGQRGGGGLRQGGGAQDAPDAEAPDDLRQFVDGGMTGPGGNAERGPRGPLTGEGFREWSDRLRDVEEMVSDPRLRAEAARIRERARAMRAEFTRHSKEPNWDVVRDFVGRPLVELRDQVAQELMRRESSEARVPIDREPVPPEYAEQVKRYYERLGSGE